MTFDTRKLGPGGTLPLGDLMPLISKSAQLNGEVGRALDQIKKKPDDVICDGMRFPGRWTHLGGERVSPYLRLRFQVAANPGQCPDYRTGRESVRDDHASGNEE